MLNAKQQRFAEEYAVDSNATQAAIRAGYSPKTAYSAGQRMLKHIEIRAHINRLQNATSERLEFTAATVTTRLLTIAEKAEKMASAPGLNVARAAIMDAAKLNGLVVETTETISRSPEERVARLQALKAERERLARLH